MKEIYMHVSIYGDCDLVEWRTSTLLNDTLANTQAPLLNIQGY